MNYQGKLTDASGKLVSDRSYEMVFGIYDAAMGGNLEWAETWDAGTGQVAKGTPLVTSSPTINKR